MDVRHEPAATLPRETRTALPTDEVRSLLCNLSHELCRPLMSLRAGFDLLLGDAARPVSADQRGHVESMVGLCDDLLRLTRGYLDYAGLVQGTRPLRLGRFGVGALVREIDREFAPVAAARGIHWECALEDVDAEVLTDATRCLQIVGNLAANALHYTPANGAVRVSARLEDGHWLVTVEDDGPGIPADEVERVFEPFYRLSGTGPSGGGAGNGLGLPICRAMVAQLGGDIQMASSVGQGTRVTVVLPRDEPAAEPARR